jgi:hypothetical protein
VHAPLQNDHVTPDTRRRERGEESCTYVLCWPVSWSCVVFALVCAVPDAEWVPQTRLPSFFPEPPKRRGVSVTALVT